VSGETTYVTDAVGGVFGEGVLQECGDLCLSPVGLSSMTKLAPTRFVGQVMGLRFLALALGNNLAGQAGAAFVVLLTPLIKRLMGGVR